MPRPPAPLAVFVGGCAGGAVRLGLDELIAPIGPGLPLDLVTINALGAFAMAMLAAWLLVSGARWWAPMAGAGALGSFTTFSALAALPWLGEATAGAAVGLLILTTALCLAAAAAGWPLGARLALRRQSGTEDAG